ncbi:MAG: hypothetical protein JW915_20135 [Chitinispirillaceae bacterium]|nr:hypothetical protein [Chitinispirillaceae bacterium]
MILEKIHLFFLQLLLLPSFLYSQTTTDTVDTAMGTDGAAAGNGMWWFWVAIFLGIVGLAIWWASRSTPPTTTTRPPKGT